MLMIYIKREFLREFLLISTHMSKTFIKQGFQLKDKIAKLIQAKINLTQKVLKFN